MFTPVPVEITAYEPEVTGLDLLHKCKFTKLRQVETIPDLARISEGTTKLEVMLDAVISYVQGVLEGRETPNNAVGRKLLDLVNSVPKMNPDEFEKMINSNMKVCIIYNQIRSDTLLRLKYTAQFYDKQCNTSIFLFQDLLMVIYLTQLTKTQLQLHEKLTAVSVNQLKDYQKLIPE